MRVFVTKEFARFARRERISDTRLCETVGRAERGLVDADLGGSLIKQRIARPRRGRSGGYRVFMAFRTTQRTVFVYGFAKNERDNIGAAELEFWQRIAAAYLGMDEPKLEAMIDQLELTEVTCHDHDQLPQPSPRSAAQER